MNSNRWDYYTDWDSTKVIELKDYGVTTVKTEEDDPIIGFTPFCGMWVSDE